MVAVAVVGCGGSGSSADNGSAGASSAPVPAAPLAEPAASREESFVNASAASGLFWVTDFTRPSLSGAEPREVGAITFGGVAVSDCDSDGDIDMFVSYGDGGPNRLYLNQLDNGNPMRFVDVAQAAGVAYTRDPELPRNDRHSGPVFADMDGDGDPDLFVGGIFGDSGRLYANQGDCTFADVTETSGVGVLLAENTLSAAFGDIDLDGDLDLFLTHWGSDDDPASVSSSEHLFRNISLPGMIRFEDVSVETGVASVIRSVREIHATSDRDSDWTLTPSIARINDDIWPDIVVAADFRSAVVLLNRPDAPGNFSEGNSQAVSEVEFGMGSALGDFDDDGDLDWFVTSIYSQREPDGRGKGNFLYENPAGDFSAQRFEKLATGVSGVANGGWGWAACFLDIDNDTDLDIYHTNGWHGAFLNDSFGDDESRVFLSRRAQGETGFVERAGDFGLDDSDDGRGVVCADFDNDGDVDILQTTNDPQNSASLWENRAAAAGRNFLRVQLVGLPPNTEAAGARIFLRVGDRTQMREVTIGSNYTSQNPTTQVFGLGTASAVDELWVEWPARVVSQGQVPVQPVNTVVNTAAISSSLGIPGATLTVCHPGLSASPDVCLSD